MPDESSASERGADEHSEVDRKEAPIKAEIRKTHKQKPLSRRMLLKRARTAAISLTGVGGLARAAEIDSERTNVDPNFLKELLDRWKKTDISFGTRLEDQIAGHRRGYLLLYALGGLLDQSFTLFSGRSVQNVDIKLPASSLRFAVVSAGFDENTSLKASAFYHLDSRSVVFVFPGMSGLQDLGVVDATIAGQPEPTHSEVIQFTKAAKNEIIDRGWVVDECIIYGLSLGAGSAIYALDEILKDQAVSRARGFPVAFGKTPPATFLAEPWKAVAAAHSTATPASNLAKHITEIRCYPGTPVDDESRNPVIGKSAAICFQTSPDLSFLGRIESHSLRWSNLKVVKSSPAELERIGTTYFVQGAEEVIKAENEPPVIAGEATVVAGLGALGWVHHRRKKVAETQQGSRPETRRQASAVRRSR